MARFYTDENFPRPVIEFLRGMGHDVLTSQEAGNGIGHWALRDLRKNKVPVQEIATVRALAESKPKNWYMINLQVPGHWKSAAPGWLLFCMSNLQEKERSHNRSFSCGNGASEVAG